jgi:alanyl-tRNA synthetase
MGSKGVTPTINIDLTTKENLKTISPETKKELSEQKELQTITKQNSETVFLNYKKDLFEQKEKDYKVSEISPKFIEKNKIDETTTSTQNILEKYMSIMSTSSSMNFEGGKIDLNFNHSVKIEGVSELTANQLVGPLKTIFEKNQGGIGNIVQQTIENKLKFGQNQVSSKKTPYFEKPMVSR